MYALSLACQAAGQKDRAQKNGHRQPDDHSSMFQGKIH